MEASEVKRLKEEILKRPQLFRKGYTPWNYEGLKINCKVCGKLFHTKKSLVEKANKQFCSIACKNKGIKQTLETRNRRRKSMQKFYENPANRKRWSEIATKMWQNEEIARKIFMSLKKRPTKPENLLIDFLNKNFPNQCKYVGNGTFWLNGKNPDFMNCNGKKLLIEFMGFYTHTFEEEVERESHFAKYGFKTLFLHYSDLENKNLLKIKIGDFQNG